MCVAIRVIVTDTEWLINDLRAYKTRKETHVVPFTYAIRFSIIILFRIVDVRSNYGR